MYLHENKELFEQTILNAAETYEIQYGIIEKDYYVTLILKELVRRIPKLIFKGGTSLSKCYHLIQRFSEDIDLNLETESHPTEGERRNVKKAIVETTEQFGFAILNIDETRSRRDYNKYKIDYPALFSINELKPYVYIETAFSIKSFPTETRFAGCIVTDFLLERGMCQLVEEYNLEPFTVNVQTLERTFIDKVFAICDYSLDGRIHEHSRHLYDLYKLYPHITFNSTLKELIEETRSSRKKNPFCLSVQEGMQINDILMRIVNDEIYKNDYRDITEKLLFDKVSYNDVVEVIRYICNSNFFT